MRAITQDTYGEVEVLQLADLPRPTAGPTEVLVEVAAAGLDRGTWHIMRGKPYLARLALGLRRPKARVPGLDLVGTIVEVGAEVTGWAAGDEVYGIGKGSFAEYAVADPAKLSRRPAGLRDEQAAVVPVSGLTAWQAVTRAGRVEPGHRVLVTGASGGVGTYAVQVAAALGAEVTAVCSAGKAELVRSLGATHVLDYAAEDVLAHGPYDVIIDIAGNPSNKRLRRALTPNGRAVIVGGETSGALAGGLGRPIRGSLASVVRRQKIVMFLNRETGEELVHLTELIESGRLTPSVDTVFPLEKVADAMAHLDSGRARGKIAIAVAETRD